jgi:peptidoglycan/xylan/chitin deacetylase (PgdA/CDA1 family)/glycosyltransferase involved in cell wall biosynthesis
MERKAEEIRVSVVIPTFNRKSLILQTLPTVLDQTFPVDRYEVVVVVDGSTDGTAEALRRISAPVRVQILEQKNAGQAAAMNAGLRAAAGEIVLFVDDDHFCERTLLEEHAAAHLDHEGLVFGPVLVDPRSPDTPATKWMQRVSENVLSHLAKEGVSLPWFATVAPNSSARRSTLLEAGGFDEGLARAFDIELGLRLWKKGVPFRFCAMARIHQCYTKSTDQLALREAPQQGQSEYLICRSYPEFRRFSQLAGITHGKALKRLAMGLSLHFPRTMNCLFLVGEHLFRKDQRRAGRIFGARHRYGVYRGAIGAAGGWGAFREEYGRLLPVLLYHRVGPSVAGAYASLTVAPERFRQQMEWLKRNGYSPIRMGDWLAWCNEGTPLPPKPVLITFDDAYADLVEHALPVLRDLGFTATIFVVTSEIGGRNTWDEKRGFATIKCMSAEQIRYWSEERMEFGAHGRTHRALPGLSAEELEEEVAGSGSDLAQVLGTAPRMFAYPYGMHNDAVRSCTAKSYSAALTSENGLNGLRTNLYLLRRTDVQPEDTLLTFALRVRFGFNQSGGCSRHERHESLQGFLR